MSILLIVPLAILTAPIIAGGLVIILFVAFMATLAVIYGLLIFIAVVQQLGRRLLCLLTSCLR